MDEEFLTPLTLTEAAYTVKDFHEAVEAPIGKWENRHKLNHKLMRERFNYILEELHEMKEAETATDLLDACTDILYYALGNFVVFGFQSIVEEAFCEVHMSNMSKLADSHKEALQSVDVLLESDDPAFLDGINIIKKEQGYVLKRVSDNKVLKANSWHHPNLGHFLEESDDDVSIC
jgi:hypothetical protein